MSVTTTIQGGPVQLTGTPIWIKLAGGVAPAGSSDYKYLLKIISQDGKLDGAPFIDAIAPDQAMEAWFNISGLVDKPVKALFQYPPSGASLSYPTQAFNIQVQSGESYFDADGVLQEIWGAVSTVFQMLKGGASQRQIALWEFAGTSFYDVYLAGGKFLTHRPWGDWVHPTQPIKLWFMALTGQSVDFKVRGVYNDSTESIYTTPITLNTDSLYEFNCNPAHLGLELEPAGKRMEYFDVSLETLGNPISDVRRFTFDWLYCERPFFLLFANSIGGIDDVYLGGFAEEKFITKGNIVYSPPLRADTVFDPTLTVPDRAGQNKWIINTGFKVPSQMLHLRDLMVSRQAWLLFPNNAVTTYVVIPVLIDDVDEIMVDRKQNIQSADIAISEAHESQFSFDNRLF